MYLCEGKPKIISRHSSNADVGAFFCIAALLQHGGITKQTPTHDIRDRLRNIQREHISKLHSNDNQTQNRKGLR